MKSIHRKRLLNVARALRESPKPKDFTMSRFANPCGTPACALGHYAARADLQRTMKIDPSSQVEPDGPLWLAFRDSRRTVDYDGTRVQEHFGISADEARELFSTYGCGEARTPKAAARYIERFVARKG